jgi:hypothetical protein
MRKFISVLRCCWRAWLLLILSQSIAVPMAHGCEWLRLRQSSRLLAFGLGQWQRRVEAIALLNYADFPDGLCDGKAFPGNRIESMEPTAIESAAAPTKAKPMLLRPMKMPFLKRQWLQKNSPLPLNLQRTGGGSLADGS